MNSVKINYHISTLMVLLLIIGLLLLASGCDDMGGITIPSGVTQLSISAKNIDNLTDPTDVVTITEAKALVSTVDFEVENSTDNQRMQMGSFVMNFSLDGTLKNLITGAIIRDNFTKVKVQFHKPEDSETPPDADFKTGSTANERYSFIIKGTYNGAAFTYKSKVSMQSIISFPKTYPVDAAQMNFTILFNRTNWFKSGTTVLNPNDPQNASLIDDNIKNSFRQAFKDDDMNGIADDH